jgi:pseudouridine synthase
MAKKHKPRHESGEESALRGERLQKVLAAAGLGSRRDCEELITAGRVEIDRQVVTELGTRVDPAKQEIRVDGEALRQPRRIYFAVNKPVGVVTTNHDPSGRPRVIDLVPTDERVFAVGRLDRSSEGLILVTNDGEFANRLTHPRYGVEKTYLVRVAGAPDQKQLARLKRGVHLAEGFAKAQSIIVKKQHGHSTDLVIVLDEGRNREIRRILARVGHKVLALKRVAVGHLKLGDLAVGAWRKLSHEEVQALLAAAKVQRRKGKKKGAGFGSQGSGVKGQESGVRSQESGDKYLQKQKLLAEPLSLDDLLRDDLDEGPLTPDDLPGSSVPLLEGESEELQGGVIEYTDEFSPPAKPAGQRTGQKHAGQKRAGPSRPGQKRAGQARDGQERTGQQRSRRPEKGRGQSREALPREDFGKKRGGKRAFGPLEAGRGPAGEKAGTSRFRPKHKKARVQGHGTDNQRRGERRVGKPTKAFGKQGGKRKGRR